jgi:hypothetical protein
MIEALAAQVRRMSVDDAVRLITSIGGLIADSRAKLNKEKRELLDRLMVHCMQTLQDPAVDRLIPVGLGLMDELEQFPQTLIDRSDQACAAFAAAGRDPMTASDLLRGIAGGSPTLLRTIAVRRDLDLLCAEGIVERRDEEATIALADNLFAPLSESLQLRCAEFAQGNAKLMTALSRRPMLTTNVAMKIFPKEGLALPWEGNQLPGLVPGSAEDQEFRRLINIGTSLRLANAGGLKALDINDLYALGRVSFDEAALLHIVSGHILPAAVLMGRPMGLPGTMITELFGQGDEFVMAAIVRWLNINPALFVVIGMANDKRRRRPVRTARALMHLYASYDPAKLDKYVRDMGAKRLATPSAA